MELLGEIVIKDFISFKKLFIYLFVGCANSSLRHEGFSLVAESKGYSIVVEHGL